MKNKFYKTLLVVLSLIMIIGVPPVNQSADYGYSGSIFITAQAAAKKIHLKKTKITLESGKSYSQKLINKKGKAISASKVKWKSANKKIASVSKKGKVTAKKSGKVKITATYKGKKYIFTVVVKTDKKEKPTTGINVNDGDSDNDDSFGEIVYITPTGSRYHLDPQCGGKNSYQTEIDVAKNKGLTPCKTCA